MRFLLAFSFLLVSYSGYSQKQASKLFSISNPENTYVAIISNEDYQVSPDVYTPDVLHAIQEGESFRQLLIKEYGLSKYNISSYANANTTQIKLALTKIAKLAQKNSKKPELIIYYTGKYVENRNEIFLLPPGVSPKELNYAISLEYVYQKLELANANRISILIDAESLEQTRKKSLLIDGGVSVEVANPNLAENTSVYIANSQKAILYDNKETPNNEVVESNKIADNIGPELTISSHKIGDNIQLTEKSVLIKGSAIDNVGLFMVSVNGQEAHLNEEGKFSARIPLVEGENTVIIQAIDINRNITTQKITIVQIPDESNKAISEALTRAMQNADSYAEDSYYALLIGVNDYQDPSMTNLDGPLHDVAEINKILTEYYVFDSEKVTVLENPTRQQIIQKLDDLERSISEKDNLLIFFAGHGTWDERVKKGYWLPADAQLNNTSNWIRNSTISGYISGIQSKHTLLIADACFSGGIFKTRSIQESPESIQKIYQLSSRKAMTSGTLKEVPDKSVFIQYLTKRLEENTEKYISAEQLFYSFKPAVLNNSENIPQYGVVKNAGDEGGDFIFIRR